MPRSKLRPRSPRQRILLFVTILTVAAVLLIGGVTIAERGTPSTRPAARVALAGRSLHAALEVIAKPADQTCFLGTSSPCSTPACSELVAQPATERAPAAVIRAPRAAPAATRCDAAQLKPVRAVPVSR